MTKRILNYEIDLDHKIGEGTFGKVYVGVNLDNNMKVAVKQLDKFEIDSDEYIKNAIYSEIQILQTVRSPNIVDFLDFIISVNHYYIVQELCDNDLRHYLKKKGPLPEGQAIKILYQICNGFVHMLKQGVIHRDLKPENILIKDGNIKIADFGLSKKIYNKRYKNHSSVGTPIYMSLQLLKFQPYSSKCDIWALGIVFYQLLHGKTPWKGQTQYHLIQNIQKIPLSISQKVSAKSRNFIQSCLVLKEQNRKSWDEILCDPIFQNQFLSYFEEKNRFQDKFKYFMNQLRFTIKAQNINLQQLFLEKGYKKQTQLDYKHFKQFLLTIDSKLTEQQEIFIFQKLDTDDTGKITYKKLQAQFIKHNIPIKQQINSFKLPTKAIINSQVKENKQNQTIEVSTKIIQCFNKINNKMKKYGLTFEKVFSAYDFNKDGVHDEKQFFYFMNKMDPKITHDEAIFIWNSINKQTQKGLSVTQLGNYLYKILRKPKSDHMEPRN